VRETVAFAVRFGVASQEVPLDAAHVDGTAVPTLEEAHRGRSQTARRAIVGSERLKGVIGLNRKLLTMLAPDVRARACGGGTASRPRRLTLWHNYGVEGNAPVTDALIAAYEAGHPGVTIDAVSQPADNYFALLKAADIAKSGPDLMTMWTGLFALQNQGYLEPLNDLIPVDTLKKFDGIDWCSKDLKVDTGAICVPLDLQFYNGFYNKELFTQAGIDAFPTTWDELYAACDKLKAINVTPMTYGTGLQALNAGFYPYYDLSYMMMMYSVEDWKKLYSGEIPWTDPKIVDQLTKWADLKTKGCTNEDVLANNESVSQFESGQAAMTLEGSWGFGEFYDKLGDKVGVFAPPFNDATTKGVVEFPGNGFGVTSYSANKQAAADFLAWMATPEAQKIIADGGLIPTVAGTEPTAPLAIAMLDYAKKTMSMSAIP
jgi:ABC-type glycerol-3-phosphate transport system substrate-binding protein